MIEGCFDRVTPDFILNAIESATGCEVTGLVAPFPSYINRVYEVESVQGERWVAKFYRPGRWSLDTLQDEHDFVFDCHEAEIPVVARIVLSDGETIGEYEDILFAIFPKKSGREMTLSSDESWRRMGSLLGRIHLAGLQYDAPNRLTMHPESTTIPEVKGLLDGGYITGKQAVRFQEITSRIIEIALVEFDGIDLQRIHGDCHRGNILERPDEGLMMIDFDDMVVGPPVQDLWLLLGDYANHTRHEINLILEGYEQFLEFDDRSLRLIEILRAMRIIYFLSWCSTQVDDFKFQHNFPNWGSEAFWNQELIDLERQYEAILNDDRLNMKGMI